MPSKLYSIADLIAEYAQGKIMPQYIIRNNNKIESIYAWNESYKDYLNVVDGHGIITDQEVSYNFEELTKKEFKIYYEMKIIKIK